MSRDAVYAGANVALFKVFAALDLKAKWSNSCEGLCIPAAEWKEFKAKMQSEARINANGTVFGEVTASSTLEFLLRSETVQLALNPKFPLGEAITTGAGTTLKEVFERLEAASAGFDGIALSGAEWEKFKDDMRKEIER
jgi:hypothetical protein